VQSLTLTNADRLAIERELARRSLAEFAKQAWHVLEPGTALRWGWSLDAICAHLEAVAAGDIIRLLMNVPPGTMKSLLTGVIYPAWVWGPLDRQPQRFFGTSHKQDLAIRDSMKCRRLIQSEWFQERWPIQLTSDQNAKTKFENDRTGAREAMAFNSMTGARADCVILDDPLSVDDANSDTALKAAELTFTEALPTRVNNDKSAIIVIMQRLHERDTSGIILERELGYTHLCLPMRFEAGRRSVTPYYADPRTKDGELLFPERFPEAQVAELERTLGSHATAGQLQQRPTPRGGGILKSEWFRFWQTQPQLEWRMIFADTAMKAGESNDWSVLQCWGRSTVGQAVLLDMVRGKWEAPELLVQARAFWLKHKATIGAPLRAMKVEDKVSGTGLIQTLRREGIPILPIQRNRDKVSRAHDGAPFIESGNVMLPESAPWLSDLLGEITAFPSGAHDDQIDPMLDAIREVQIAPAAVHVASAIITPRPALGARRKF
jgi:predicted phage terminase large subunit-like protein